jgi:hypothetical protein
MTTTNTNKIASKKKVLSSSEGKRNIDPHLSLFIPHVFPNCAELHIFEKHFRNAKLGNVGNVEFRTKTTANNEPFFIGFVHMSKWFDTQEAFEFQQDVLTSDRGGEVYYSKNLFWLCKQYLRKSVSSPSSCVAASTALVPAILGPGHDPIPVVPSSENELKSYRHAVLGNLGLGLGLGIGIGQGQNVVDTCLKKKELELDVGNEEDHHNNNNNNNKNNNNNHPPTQAFSSDYANQEESMVDDYTESMYSYEMDQNQDYDQDQDQDQDQIEADEAFQTLMKQQQAQERQDNSFSNPNETFSLVDSNYATFLELNLAHEKATNAERFKLFNDRHARQFLQQQAAWEHEKSFLTEQILQLTMRNQSLEAGVYDLRAANENLVAALKCMQLADIKLRL